MAKSDDKADQAPLEKKGRPTLSISTVPPSARAARTANANADIDGATEDGMHEVRVDLNERCFLFPAGKGVSHLVLAAGPDGFIDVRAVFAYNLSRADSTIDRFSLDEARMVARGMVEGIYQARTQTVFLTGRRLGLVCNTNGFVIIGHDDAYELFISGQIMISVAQALLRAVDKVAPIEAH